jgi:uncharacterized OsmC-like protein
MAVDTDHHVTVRLARDHEFVAEFPDLPTAPAVLFDEPPPLGGSRGPSAADMLGAAVGNCLAASLKFCLEKVRIDVDNLTANVTTHVIRNERGRFRVGSIDVELTPEVADADPTRFARCEALFEDFCIVTASVRSGITVNVHVNEPAGAKVAAGH